MPPVKDQSARDMQHSKKIGEVWLCSFHITRAYRQTDRQTYRRPSVFITAPGSTLGNDYGRSLPFTFTWCTGRLCRAIVPQRTRGVPGRWGSLWRRHHWRRCVQNWLFCPGCWYEVMETWGVWSDSSTPSQYRNTLRSMEVWRLCATVAWLGKIPIYPFRAYPVWILGGNLVPAQILGARPSARLHRNATSHANPTQQHVVAVITNYPVLPELVTIVSCSFLLLCAIKTDRQTDRQTDTRHVVRLMLRILHKRDTLQNVALQNDIGPIPQEFYSPILSLKCNVSNFNPRD